MFIQTPLKEFSNQIGRSYDSLIAYVQNCVREVAEERDYRPLQRLSEKQNSYLKYWEQRRQQLAKSAERLIAILRKRKQEFANLQSLGKLDGLVGQEEFAEMRFFKAVLLDLQQLSAKMEPVEPEEEIRSVEERRRTGRGRRQGGLAWGIQYER